MLGFKRTISYRYVSMRYILTILITLTIFVTVQRQSYAAVNDTINFQAKIVDIADGTNVDDAATACILAGVDTCDFQVSIYSEEVGGTLLWQETHENIEIADTNGVFNIALNSQCNEWEAPVTSPTCTGTPTASGLTWGNDDTVYLELAFSPAGTSTFTETFSRKLFQSVPYSLYADVAASIVGGLDTVYHNDADKTLTVNDASGLRFDLVTTGDLEVAENGTVFFTFAEDNSVTYNPDDATDTFTLANGNLVIGSGGTPGLTLNGEDAYIEGSLEVDDAVDFGSDVNFNNNEAIGFRIENADGGVSVPACNVNTQGRQYYDIGDDNAYVCVESSPSIYSWFNLTQTIAATSTKVVTVGTTGDYASVAAAAGYLNTLTGGIILLAPETHNVSNGVDLENITLIGANIQDTVINITGSGSLRSRQTQFENLTIAVDAGIVNTSGIDMLEEIGANSTTTFQWVDFDINGGKFLIDSSEVTAPVVSIRFESTSATSGTGNILPTQGVANLNAASQFIVSSQGDSGALNFQDWDVEISGSGKCSIQWEYHNYPT